MIPSIIVVGPDRVGKTTTVQHLSRILGVPTFKSPGEKRIFQEGGRSSLVFDYGLTHLLGQTGFSLVSDRGYPCEWVYSRVFGRQTDHQLLEMIDAGHAFLGTKILYVYSSTAPLEEDDLVPAEKYWEVKETYDRFVRWTSCGVTAVDSDQMLAAFSEGEDDSLQFAEMCVERMGLLP